MNKAIELLEGAYDLHLHTAPDVVDRKIDDIDMAKEAEKVKMKGFAIKSHYFSTAERARLTRKVVPSVNTIGAVVLNNTVGGFNPSLVEIAGRDGAKIVWMPTVDAKNERDFFKAGKYTKLPFWAKIEKDMDEMKSNLDNLTILDDDNNIKKEVLNIIDIISNRDMVLATGHLGKKETFELVKMSKKMGLNKIIITHPNFPSTFFTKEEQKELSEMGAYMEHCFTTVQTNKVAWETMYEQIKYVGPENCILSTDLGQPSALNPIEGLKLFYNNLLENNFSIDELKLMSQENTKYLVE